MVLLEEVVGGGWMEKGPFLDLRVPCQVLMACRECLAYEEGRRVRDMMRRMVEKEEGVFYRGPVGLEMLQEMPDGPLASFALLQCMLEDGLPPDSLSYGLVLEACGVAGRYDGIMLLYEKMRQSEGGVKLGRAAPWKPLEPWEQMATGEKEVVARVVEALEACGDDVMALVDEVYEEVCEEGMFSHWMEEGDMVDLHHLTTPLARAAIRHVYQDALGGRQSKLVCRNDWLE